MNDSVSPAFAARASLTILCVDDEANILSALRRLLRPHGYQVLVADSGSGGLDIMEHTHVDLVLSYMSMPEMDGVRFLEQVKARSPDTIRILLTGYADLDSTIGAINHGGVYRYIAKPWDGAALVDIVQDALERKLLEREKARLEQLTGEQNAQLKALNATLEEKVLLRTAELATALTAVQEAHATLTKGFFTSVRVFANLIELREGAMAGHARRVADHAGRMARRLKLDDADVQDVALAGLLHGIGELGIPDAVLRRGLSTLSFDEHAAVMKHPRRGQAALMGLDQLAGAGKLIRSYRERYDGAGYPDALNGLEIPVGARIVAIAHDYEAAQDGTLSGCCLSRLQARDHILSGRGTRYDPALLDTFVAIVEEEGVTPRTGKSLAPAALKEGMVLAQDLVSPDGLLLLSKGSVLGAPVIGQLCKYDLRDGKQLDVRVRTS